MKRRRRSRTLSVEAEIRAKAKQIMDDNMVEAMRAAALLVVGRKLDEISALLRSIGATDIIQSPARSVGSVQAVGTPHVAQPTPIEHPCVLCGREGVRRTKPSQWNRTGSWYCAVHVAHGAAAEFEDRVDSALLGPQAGPALKRPTVVITHPPAAMRQETPAPVESAVQPTSTTATDVPGAGSLEDALGALGVN